MSDEERQPPPKRPGNVTMQIDAFRDQVELYDDADEGDVQDSPRSVAPPPLPPRTLDASASAPASAPTKPPIATIAIGVVVAAVAVGAALWVSGMLVDEPPPSPEEAPAMEIGPIEIDTQAPPTGE